MSRYISIKILLIPVGVAILTVLWLYDPVQVWWAPQCPVHYLTGWQCPACGISRALHALLHGRWFEALCYNWFFIVSVPYLLIVTAVLYIPALRSRHGLYRVVTGRIVGWAYVALFCSWFVIRNIIGI